MSARGSSERSFNATSLSTEAASPHVRGARHPEPRHPFAGEAAVVTGASRGIGAALAAALAHEGFRLFLVARDADRLKAVAEALTARGATATWFAWDLIDPDAPDVILRAATEHVGVPYLLVNNAGVTRAQRFERRLRMDWERELTLDLVVPMRLAHTFLPGMLARGRGHLLFMGSASADVPLPRLAAYSTAKAGLRSFALVLDMELRHRGVRATVLEPLFVRTALGRRPEDHEDPMESLAHRYPWLVLRPETVAKAAVRAVHDPRPWVPVPWSWHVLRLLWKALGPLSRARMSLPPPPAGQTPDSGSPFAPSPPAPPSK